MRLFSRNYLSKYWRFLLPIERLKMYFLYRKSQKKNFIIHTPGKVASTSAYVTLKKILANTHHVFHFHYISSKGIKEMKRQHLESKRKSLPHHLIISQEFARQFNAKPQKLQMLVLLREPIGRFISATFQNLNMYFKNTKNLDSIEVEHLILRGLKNRQHLSDLCWWFDTEIKENFNIDVFKDDNLKVSNGDYWYFKNNQIDLYIIQMEKLSTVFTNFCSTELNLNEVELINSNIASNKSYSKIYKEVKKRIEIPDEVIEITRASRFMERFYKS